MATKNFTVSKQMIADIYSGSANPGDLHIPIGRWDPGTGLSWTTRAALYAPISFAGMTSITSARLYLRAHVPASGWHAKGTETATIYARRKTADWSEAGAGTSTAVDETWGGDGDAIVETSIGTEIDFNNFDSLVDGTWYSIDITDIVNEWFAGSANYGLVLHNATSETDSGKAKEFRSRHYSGSAPYIQIEYSTNTTPNAPTSLSPDSGVVRNSGTSVTVSGTRSDPDSGDYITGYQIQVYNSDLSVKYHDSYTYPSGTPTTFSKVISGLPTKALLQWRARTRDKGNAWGPWSSYATCYLNTPPNAPSLSMLESPSSAIPTTQPTFKITHSDADSGDTKAYGYRLYVTNDATGVSVYDSGEVTVSPKTTVSFKIGSGILEHATTYRWNAMTKDSDGVWGPLVAVSPTFTIAEAGVPTSLSPSGNVRVGSLVPTFSGNRASASDTLDEAQIQVYANNGSTLIWDSGWFSAGVTNTVFSKAYGGTALSYDTAYKWRARITTDAGSTSEWSSLQSFRTPLAGAIVMTAPSGSDLTDLTPQMEFSRTGSFNAYQIQVIDRDASDASVWSTGTVGHASATSKSITYAGTALDWANAYAWRVRVSSDGGSTWGDGWTDYVEFATAQANVPALSAPGTTARLGAPWHVVVGESLAGVTGSAASTVTAETTIFNEGYGSLKAAIAALNGTQDVITVTGPLDLSDYGAATLIKAAVRVSSLTNVTNIRLRFTDSLGSTADYTITPSGTGAFEEESVAKGSPVATSGTIDWADIASVKVRVTTSASATFDLYLDDVRLDATNPSFDGAASGGETIDTVRIIVYASDQATVVWDSGEVNVDATEFSVAYAGSALTPGQTYYWTARYTASTGPVGGYASMLPFSLNATPGVPTSLSPATGSVEADTLTPEFSANFSDPDVGDLPTLFEVEVYRNSDSVLMHTLRSTTDLVVGANTVQRTSEGTALSYEVEYKWRARYADSMGVYGPWSSYSVFEPSEPPVTTITSPVSTISSPSFDVVWSFTSPGAKAQNRFRVRITRDSDEVLIYDSGLVYSSVSSHTVPGGLLVNSTDYTIGVIAYDTDGLASAEDTEAITSSWAAPDSVAGFSVSALLDTSEMLLVWDESALDTADFSYYQIYRREQGDEWEQYARIVTKSQTEYSDFYAGHSLTYEYKITVWKKVVGDVDIESSDSEVPYAILDPDAWFVIGADRDDSHIFELPVYDETHTEPIQQEVFEPLGSRRKSIVRGKVLGAEGSLQVQWTDDERRTAQTQLRYLTDNRGPHILKSPFGDVWEVEFAGPAKKYTGGGHLGVTLTWIEVR